MEHIDRNELDEKLRSSFVYCSKFCEENVYQMVLKLNSIFPSLVYAVFISSDCKMTPIWHQLSAEDSSTPVLWDYHVVLLVKGYSSSLDTISSVLSILQNGALTGKNESTVNNQAENSTNKEDDGVSIDDKNGITDPHIFDLDSNLIFPCEAGEYYNGSFRPEIKLKKEHRQLFRVVSADDFMNHFASDRYFNTK
jgi:hypothetical protein